MKSIKLSARLFFFFLILLFVTNVFGQGYPIQVTSFIKPPFPTKFEDWEDFSSKIVLNLTNLTGSEYEINAKLTIEGPNGLHVQKNNLFNSPLQINAYKSLNIKGQEWDLYGINLKIEDITPESERNFVLKNRAFREGSYSICIQAVNPITGQPMSEPSPSGCYTFEVIYGEAPIIINPTMDQVVQAITPTVVSINWTHQVLGAPFEYSIKIIEISAYGSTDVNQAMNNPGYPTFYEEDEILGFSKVLRNEDFKAGHKYAVRITATDPQKGAFFKNAGHSDIIQFVYGADTGPNCNNLNEFAIQAHFPMNGDTLPFVSIPLVGQFLPQCPDYHAFRYTTTFNGAKNKEVLVNWPKGALQYLKDGLSDNTIDWNMASKLPLLEAATSLERGKSYSWSATTSSTDKDGKIYSRDLPKTTFVTGMPKPILGSPMTNEKVGAGIITFSWRSVARQSKLLPDFRSVLITEVKGKKTVKNTKVQDIDEHWVLQVFSEDNVNNAKLVGYKDGKISLKMDDYFTVSKHSYNTASLINELSKDLTAEIEIKKEGDYWWRVVWLKNPAGSATSLSETSIYHASGLKKFHVGPKDDPDIETGGECLATCDAAEITEKEQTGDLKVNQVLKIGLFDLKVTKIDKSTGNVYSGKGEIVVDFMNKIKIEVEFANIKKNKVNQIFEGTVKATKDVSFFTKYDQYVKYAKQGAQEGLKQLKLKNAKELSEEIEKMSKSTERLVSSVLGLRATGLPVGIDKEIDGYKLIVAIVDMQFTPQKATMQSIINVKIPAIKFDLDEYMVLKTQDICFSPGGLGVEGKAYLDTDAEITIDQDGGAAGNELVIKGKGKGTSSLDNVTYAAWDCKGFKSLTVALEYKFSRKVIIPDQKGDLGRVVAKGTFKTTRGLDLMGQISIGDFQLPYEQLKGYGFKVTDAWIDFSSVSNPDGLKANLPANYKSNTLTNKDPRLSNVWQGFWLKSMEVKIPEYIGNVNENNRNTQVKVNNMIIDESGFTASFLIKDLIKWESNPKDVKHIDGCAFSMDSLWVKVLQNNLSEGGLSGKVGLPIAEKRDYLVYRGLIQNGQSKSGIQFSIIPDKDISIPISFAQLKINKTSTFKMSLGDNSKSFVEFNLNAEASIKGNPLDKDDKSKDILNLPKVTIENLKFNSTAGFDSKDFKFKLASPQKWLAGFPVSLKDYSFTGGPTTPKVKFTVALSLMNSKDKSTQKEKGGFSSEATISIEGKINTNAELLKMLSVEKVELKKIALDVKISTVGLKGSLEFYDEKNKNGVKGDLQVTLPAGISAGLKADFGTYQNKANKNAQFNTTEWYSYWYVAGNVKFGKAGVPVFSGLNLYGLNGGVYHHMKRISGTATIPYEPDFRNDLGLQFGADFGSADGGKAFNFDVSLEAAFSASYGMTYFGFRGNANVMTSGIENKKDSEGSVAGYVEIEYHNNVGSTVSTESDKEFVEGKFLVTVNTPIIKGAAQNITYPPESKTKSGAFVLASFYAKVDSTASTHKVGYWFFNMGKPEARGALAVDLSPKPDKKKPGEKASTNKLEVKFTSYLMIGHDVPLTIPPPSEEFMNIYKKAGGTSNFSGGKVESLTKGEKKLVLPPGEGFAFGAGFSATIKANPIPFYFNASAALGFDINMTHSDQRTCLETNQAPGYDGWYSTGQIYAGIELGVGIKVDLFFIKGEFSVFDGAAAMILQGGFPNPNWAAGEGHINYKILNGLFKGHYFFEFELGQKCTPTMSSSEYLAKLKFIQDIKPVENDKEVNVFTACTATFALPVDKVIEIPVDAKKVKKFKPEIHKWTLKDHKTGLFVPCELIELNREKVVGTLNPKVILNGKTKYVQELEVRVKEYLLGHWTPVLDKNNNYWSEKKTSTFNTGKAPSVIVDDNVVMTYPIRYQRSFFKNETKDFKGYIVQEKGTPDLFKEDRNYIVRFTKLDGSDVFTETNLIKTDGDRTLSFDISTLQNDQFYCLQIIGKPKTGLSDLVIMGNGPVEPNFEEFGADNLLVGGRNVLTSDIIKKRTLPGDKVRNDKEVLLYYYYFKTSKYNSFRDKFTASSWNSTLHSGFGIERFSAHTMINESLEQYDKSGYTSHGYQIPPLISLTINDGKVSGISEDNPYPQYPLNNYIDEKVNPLIRETVDNTNKVLNKSYIDDQVEYQKVSFSTAIEWGSNASFSGPLTKQELNIAVNQGPGSSGGGFGYLGGGFINNGTPFGNMGGSDIFFSGLDGSALSSEVEVYDNMPIYGRLNFNLAKNDMARVLSEELPLFDKNSIPVSYNLYPDADYWVHKFLGYPTPGIKYSYYQNKYKDHHPKVGDFLNIFYAQVGFMANMLATISPNYMNPPRENSFIMQYQYPAPYSFNKKAYMNKGTSFRVSYNK